MNAKSLLLIALGVSLIASIVSAGHISTDKSPFKFSIFAKEPTQITLGILALDDLKNPQINGTRLAATLPAESSIVIRPDGTALFAYQDLFLRHYRGRQQVLNGKDPHGRPAEDFLNFPKEAQPPKFLRDIYKVNATHLCFNAYEDILWWTGELIYRFEFPFPVKSLKLESPNGVPTVVGDWDWDKAGRAVKIYASTNGNDWKLMWQSHGKGGVTSVYAELPDEFLGAKTVYLKFWGQNANVLFQLYVTATLDAKSLLPLLRLRQGKNEFTFSDDIDSSHRAIIFWEGKGVKCMELRKKAIVYPRGKPTVNEGEDEIAVLFPERVGVWVYKRDGKILGIKRLTCEQREILNARIVETPLAYVLEGEKVEGVSDWAAYLLERQKLGGEWKKLRGVEIKEMSLDGRYIGWRKEGKGIALRCAVSSGEVEWVFTPREFAGYRGVSIELRLKGLPKVFAVSMSEHFCPQGGDWKFSRTRVEFERQFPVIFEKSHEYPYFAEGQPFFFVCGAEGSVVSFFDEAVVARVSEILEGDRIVVRSRIPVRAGEVTKVAAKSWLYRKGDFSNKWDAVNEWTRVFDEVTSYYQKRYRIKPVKPLPIIWDQTDGAPGINLPPAYEKYKQTKKKPPLTESWFYRYAEEVLPKLAQWGIKVIYLLGGIESEGDHSHDEYLPGSGSGGSLCAPWALEVSPALGGEEGLAYLCRKAHSLGMKIILWSTPAHLSNSSPLLRKHPEWLAWKADGTPENYGYRDITGVNLKRGYLDYAIRQYEKIRKATGFDGVFQDSFLTFGVLTDFSEEAPYPQLEDTLEMQRRLQEMGCSEIIIEGQGPFGLSALGFESLGIIKGREYLLYRCIGVVFSWEKEMEFESYYRALGSGGVMAPPSIAQFEALPQQERERIIRANKDLEVVQEFMHRRCVLKDFSGVEWTSADGKTKVVFAFKGIEVKAKGLRVYDVTAGREVSAVAGKVQLQPWHTYILRSKRGAR